MGSLEISGSSLLFSRVSLEVSGLSPNTEVWDRSASKSFGRAGCSTWAIDPFQRPPRCCQLCDYFSLFLLASAEPWHWHLEQHRWGWGQRKYRNRERILGQRVVVLYFVFVQAVTCTKNSKFCSIYPYAESFTMNLSSVWRMWNFLSYTYILQWKIFMFSKVPFFALFFFTSYLKC